MLKSLTLLAMAAFMSAAASPGFAQDDTTAAPAAAAPMAAAPAVAPAAAAPAAPAAIATGMTLTIMADGKVVTGQPAEADAAAMAKDMKLVKGCIVFLMSADGQLYQQHRGARKCNAGQ